MPPVDAASIARALSSQQAALVRYFLSHLKPADLERFRDVPNGTFTLDGTSWSHRRHGAGVTFTSADNAVINAHVSMATHPEAIDAWRMYQYAESRGMHALRFEGKEYPVTHRGMDQLIAHMTEIGFLQSVITRERFPHRVYELGVRAQGSS